MSPTSTSTPWPQLLLERTARPHPRVVAHAEAQRHLARFEEDYEELALSLQWLEQAIDGIPAHAKADAASATLRLYLKDLGDVRASLQHALKAAAHVEIEPLLVEGAALVEYFHGLYDWCEELQATFEEFARGLRRQEPIWPVFQQRTVNKSFARFDQLTALVHEDVRRLHAASREPADGILAFDHRLEELFWAASWLHLSLTKRFGE